MGSLSWIIVGDPPQGGGPLSGRAEVSQTRRGNGQRQGALKEQVDRLWASGAGGPHAARCEGTAPVGASRRGQQWPHLIFGSGGPVWVLGSSLSQEATPVSFQLATATWSTEGTEGVDSVCLGSLDSQEWGGGLFPGSEPLASLTTLSTCKALLGAA